MADYQTRIIISAQDQASDRFRAVADSAVSLASTTQSAAEKFDRSITGIRAALDLLDKPDYGDSLRQALKKNEFAVDGFQQHVDQAFRRMEEQSRVRVAGVNASLRQLGVTPLADIKGEIKSAGSAYLFAKQSGASPGELAVAKQRLIELTRQRAKAYSDLRAGVVDKPEASSQSSTMLGRLSDSRLGRGYLSVAATVGGVATTVVAAKKIYDNIKERVETVKESSMLAARYDTLGVSMHVLGQNAGHSVEKTDAFATSLERTGIAAIESRQAIAQLITSQIDLEQSTKLARLAQDAAVVGGVNSSEAFQKMVVGIQSAQVEMLRSIGINVSFEASYRKMADELGKTSDSLTEKEKMRARTEAVLSYSPRMAGTYEASMNTVGKQIASQERYRQNFQVAFGAIFQEAMTDRVQRSSDALKRWTEILKDPGIKASLSGIVTMLNKIATLPEKTGSWAMEKLVKLSKNLSREGNIEWYSERGLLRSDGQPGTPDDFYSMPPEEQDAYIESPVVRRREEAYKARQRAQWEKEEARTVRGLVPFFNDKQYIGYERKLIDKGKLNEDELAQWYETDPETYRSILDAFREQEFKQAHPTKEQTRKREAENKLYNDFIESQDQVSQYNTANKQYYSRDKQLQEVQKRYESERKMLERARDLARESNDMDAMRQAEDSLAIADAKLINTRQRINELFGEGAEKASALRESLRNENFGLLSQLQGDTLASTLARNLKEAEKAKADIQKQIRAAKPGTDTSELNDALVEVSRRKDLKDQLARRQDALSDLENRRQFMESLSSTGAVDPYAARTYSAWATASAERLRAGDDQIKQAQAQIKLESTILQIERERAQATFNARGELAKITGDVRGELDVNISLLRIQLSQAKTAEERALLEAKIAQIQARKNLDVVGLVGMGLDEYRAKSFESLVVDIKDYLPRAFDLASDSATNFLDKLGQGTANAEDAIKALRGSLTRLGVELAANAIKTTLFGGLAPTKTPVQPRGGDGAALMGDIFPRASVQPITVEQPVARSEGVRPAMDLGKGVARWSALTKYWEEYHGLPTGLLSALMRVESNGNPEAVNKTSGATGLMQVMPANFSMFGGESPTDPAANVRVGARIAADFYHKHNGDLAKTLAGYGGFVSKDPSAYIAKVTAAMPQGGDGDYGAAGREGIQGLSSAVSSYGVTGLIAGSVGARTLIGQFPTGNGVLGYLTGQSQTFYSANSSNYVFGQTSGSLVTGSSASGGYSSLTGSSLPLMSGAQTRQVYSLVSKGMPLSQAVSLVMGDSSGGSSVTSSSQAQQQSSNTDLTGLANKAGNSSGITSALDNWGYETFGIGTQVPTSWTLNSSQAAAYDYWVSTGGDPTASWAAAASQNGTSIVGGLGSAVSGGLMGAGIGSALSGLIYPNGTATVGGTLGGALGGVAGTLGSTAISTAVGGTLGSVLGSAAGPVGAVVGALAGSLLTGGSTTTTEPTGQKGLQVYNVGSLGTGSSFWGWTGFKTTESGLFGSSSTSHSVFPSTADPALAKAWDKELTTNQASLAKALYQTNIGTGSIVNGGFSFDSLMTLTEDMFSDAAHNVTNAMASTAIQAAGLEDAFNAALLPGEDYLDAIERIGQAYATTNVAAQAAGTSLENLSGSADVVGQGNWASLTGKLLGSDSDVATALTTYAQYGLSQKDQVDNTLIATGRQAGTAIGMLGYGNDVTLENFWERYGNALSGELDPTEFQNWNNAAQAVKAYDDAERQSATLMQSINNLRISQLQQELKTVQSVKVMMDGVLTSVSSAYSTYRSLNDSLTSTSQSIRWNSNLSGLTPSQTYQEQTAYWNQLKTKVQSEGPDSLTYSQDVQKLNSFASTYLQTARSFLGNSAAYKRVYSDVTSTIDDLESETQTQVDLLKQQLEAQNAIVNAAQAEIDQLSLVNGNLALLASGMESLGTSIAEGLASLGAQMSYSPDTSAAITEANTAQAVALAAMGYQGGYAVGGDFTAGTMLVGEYGPELIRTSMAGHVLPNNDLSDLFDTTHLHAAMMASNQIMAAGFQAMLEVMSANLQESAAVRISLQRGNALPRRARQ